MWILNRLNFNRLQDGLVGWLVIYSLLSSVAGKTERLRKMETSRERENKLIVVDVREIKDENEGE